jgi:hypothetical protein
MQPDGPPEAGTSGGGDLRMGAVFAEGGGKLKKKELTGLG